MIKGTCEPNISSVEFNIKNRLVEGMDKTDKGGREKKSGESINPFNNL